MIDISNNDVAESIKILDKYESQLGIADSNIFDSLKGLPFYNWDSVTDFSKRNDRLISIMQSAYQERTIVPCPLFDYEQMLYDTLQQTNMSG